MKHLDKQMLVWSEKLISELKIKEEDTKKLATIIASEVRWLPDGAKREIKEASPVDIKYRYEELLAFQGWMDIVHKSEKHPAVIRAQVIVQNYICFVYLNESCFNILRKHLPFGSSSKKCCSFLVNNPVRAFRNAIAHSNWCYKDDFSGLRYWARKGTDPNESLTEFEVNQTDLAFWQMLARCVAYSVYENLNERTRT
jgi:hypothetical protein